MADLCLFYLNRKDNFHYAKLFNMNGPSDQIDDVLNGKKLTLDLSRFLFVAAEKMAKFMA